MDAKEAVQIAKSCVNDLFGEDGVDDVRLEEIEHDEMDGTWSVTLGFLRRNAAPERPVSGLLAALDAVQARTRVLRVVNIRGGDGAVLSVKQPRGTRDAA